MKRIFLILIATVFVYFVSFLPWSYSQIDPNLLLSTNPSVVAMEQTMLAFSHNRQAVTIWYEATIAVLFLLYFALWFVMQRQTVVLKKAGILLFLVIAFAFTLLSHPALSHDIYNYIFNAKIIWVYHADPSIAVALNYAPDPWLRFMHNVHTTSPYGFVWNAISLVPFIAGMGKFLPILLFFKTWMLVAGIGLITLQYKLLRLLFPKMEKKHITSRLLLFVLNPLVVIETLSTGHNDVWMMLLVLFSIYTFFLFQTKKHVLWLVVSILTLAASVEIKFASAAMIPLYLLLLSSEFKKLLSKLPRFVSRIQQGLYEYWPEIAGLLLFLPLLTQRSERFHPWYLIWSLSFLPFMKARSMKVLLLVFSVTAMLRYVPFLYFGDYSQIVTDQQLVITWSAVIIGIAILLVMRGIHAFRGSKKA